MWSPISWVWEYLSRSPLVLTVAIVLSIAGNILPQRQSCSDWVVARAEVLSDQNIHRDRREMLTQKAKQLPPIIGSILLLSLLLFLFLFLHLRRTNWRPPSWRAGYLESSKAGRLSVISCPLSGLIVAHRQQSVWRLQFWRIAESRRLQFLMEALLNR